LFLAVLELGPLKPHIQLGSVSSVNLSPQVVGWTTSSKITNVQDGGSWFPDGEAASSRRKDLGPQEPCNAEVLGLLPYFVEVHCSMTV
jgi:hypothetical protein